MKISIVIPVHNEEDYIERCLQSIVKQKVKASEIIVVDNNCTDRTVEIAKQFPVKIVQEKKQGIAYARNRGFNEAKYDIIGRCDADSVLPPYWIRRVLSDFNSKKIDAVTGPLEFYDLKIQYSKTLFNLYAKTLYTVARHYPLHGPNMAISRSIWKKIKDEACLDNEEVHEDFDLSMHIYNKGGVIFFDSRLVAKISARRIKNDPSSFFIDYPTKAIRTMRRHAF